MYTPTSELYNDIWGPEHSRNLAVWEGEARAAYDEIVEQQQNAVQQMVKIADDLSIWLSDVAIGNTEFIISLQSQLAQIANTLIEEAG
jgi:hypothetical protein